MNVSILLPDVTYSVDVPRDDPHAALKYVRQEIQTNHSHFDNAAITYMLGGEPHGGTSIKPIECLHIPAHAQFSLLVHSS